MSWNVSKISTYAGYETERIIQGLDPDVTLLQEWAVDTGEYTDIDDWVDTAFGVEFDYYRGLGVEGDWCQKNGIVSRWTITSSGSWSDSYITNRYYDWAVIDIPNSAIDLQVVVVHLHSSDEPTRILEVQELIGYIEANFSNSHYLLIGGDFNTAARTDEPIPTLLDDAEWTGTCWVTTSDGTPVDKNGDEDTNVLRLSNYDWLIPNILLGDEIMSLNLGGDGDPYTGGIVFDSRVFTPLSAVPPIVYGDTANGDQDHCPVMKSYDILPAAGIVLNEIMPNPATDYYTTTGTGSTLDTYNEYIEIYNAGASAADVSGWRIKKDGVLGPTIDTTAGTQSVPAGGHILIVRDDTYAEAGNPNITGNRSAYTGGWWSGLANTGDYTVTLHNSSDVQQDSVAVPAQTFGDDRPYYRNPEGSGSWVYASSSSEASPEGYVLAATATPTRTPTLTPTPTPTESYVLNEDFEGSFPPAGWTQYDVEWSTTYNHTPSGTYSAKLAAAGDYLITPQLTGSLDELTFWYYTTAADPDVVVNYSPNLSTWYTLGASPYSGTTEQWVEVPIDVSSYSNIYVRWQKSGTGTLYVDDVTVTEGGGGATATPTPTRTPTPTITRTPTNTPTGPTPTPGEVIRINYQPSAAATPSGYWIDSGSSYGYQSESSETYGWL